MNPRLVSERRLELVIADPDQAQTTEDQDAQTYELEVRKEVVEGGVVDDPATLASAGGWMADRRTYMNSAPAVIAPYLRDAAQLNAAVKFVIRYYTHKTAFHTVRVPLYWARLAGQGPRGARRLTDRWWRWVTDAEARPVMTSVSGGKDGDVWARVVTVGTQRTKRRWRNSAVIGIPAALLVTLAAVFLPDWQLVLAAAGVSTLLGLAGGRRDKPIVRRYVSVHLQRRLDAPEVEAAIEAIGIKGKVSFVSPIAVDGPGWRAEIDLPGANQADDALEARSGLAAAMRRPLSTVWPETDPDAHPGRLILWIAREDPSKAKRRIWPLMHEGQADLFAPVPFGFDPRGRLVTLSLTGANVLIGGVMGSGKTSAVLDIALAGALDPTCEEWIYELKGSGDLDALKPVCHRYVSGDDDEHCDAALDGLKALEKELKRRKAVVAALPLQDVPNGRKVSKALAARKNLRLHPLLAIFDEAHTLFEHEELGKEAAAVAGRLIRKARAYGIIIVFTTQRPDTKSIPRAISDNAIIRFCLAVTGHIPNNLVLGSGMYARGVRATMFDPRKDAGTGWLALSALSAQIVRAAYITQAEAFDIVKRALAVRVAAGTLTGEAAGETIEAVDDSDLIDHLLTVWPDGEDTMHSHRLVEALAAYRPEAYGQWLEMDQTGQSTTLSTALRPYKVKTRQVQKRGDGGSAKGLHLVDLEAMRTGEDDPDID